MTFVILSLLYGVVAGAFLQVAVFAIGLALFALVAGLSATATGWGLFATVLAVIVFAQLGYFTTVYYRASAVAAKRESAVRGPAEAPPARRDQALLAERPSTED